MYLFYFYYCTIPSSIDIRQLVNMLIFSKNKFKKDEEKILFYFYYLFLVPLSVFILSKNVEYDL